ncbi:MAG: ATP-dependent RNA helicase HrpA [Verrucomicrobia bacterium]|nr:ATP-dependent RNA helicase HrpA [Verrucomicrobiota bacterium]
MTAIEQLKTLLPQCVLADQVRLGSRLARILSAPRLPAAAPAIVQRLLDQARHSIRLRHERARLAGRIRYSADLPITARREEIVTAIRAHPVVILAGETGSGKSTQLPKMCLEAGFGARAMIGCTQPRRVAAVSLSRRIAEELDVEWGGPVGCQIRFASHTRPETSIKLMTDGILLAEIQSDPALAQYEVILLDEAHERSLNIDFLLGYLKGLLERRNDLKLLITSATIDTRPFSAAFGRAPVIEVSGRMFPIETIYRPIDEQAEETGDQTYIDAAVAVVQEIVGGRGAGDILVFMPAERDIGETRDRLEASLPAEADLVPLFGRLSAAEQQRVFAPSTRRKIVIATNIAETSLTIPGIRYVVDTGLARISRYNPRTRTRRLPVEPISQSSADQRQGRCGRISSGVCYRLFSAADFSERPLYTMPEIQRANLAEVILRLEAFRLGAIESFPFLDPPAPAAIQAGYQLLQELGALDEHRQLTPLGLELARLPIDPTIGRMILEARHENALPEVLVIAAGLSIQDPRERPLDQQASADAAQRRFQDPSSDFLALLNIWNAYHDTWDTLKTQNQLRKFCRSHFLSYRRMREWRDLHAQLEESLADLDGFQTPPAPASPAAIHRSILTGLWSNVARRAERNLYQIAGSRTAMIFPGSGLFHKTASCPKTPGGAAPRGRVANAGSGDPAYTAADARNVGRVPSRGGAANAASGDPAYTAANARNVGRVPSRGEASNPASHQPDWLVAGELVETSRLFLRTAAAIDSAWILELAPHLCRRKHRDPRFDPSSGRVLVNETVTLNGLTVQDHSIPFERVDPEGAAALFIRAALIEEQIRDHWAASHPPPAAAEVARPAAAADARRRLDLDDPARSSTELVGPPSAVAPLYRFLEHNHQLRQKIEIWQTRLRHRVIPDLDAVLEAFYRQQMPPVSSVVALNRLLRERVHRAPLFLQAQPAHLLGEHAAEFDPERFPDAVPVGDQSLPVTYSYAPGQDHDGVTLHLPVTLAEVIEPGLLEWLVPCLREERLAHMLHHLPKSIRRQLLPLAPKAREIARALAPRDAHYLKAVSRFVLDHYGVAVPVANWPAGDLPSHLQPRLEAVGPQSQPLAASRGLEALRDRLTRHDSTAESDAWQRAARQWERYRLTHWTLGDLPESILVAEIAGFPLRAFPGLDLDQGDVHLRLFRAPADAARATRAGLPRLAEVVLARDLAWLMKDLRQACRRQVLCATLGPIEPFIHDAESHLRAHLLADPPLPPLTAAGFASFIDRAHLEIRDLVPRFSDRLGQILELRQQILLHRRPYSTLRADLERLVHPGFLRSTPFARLAHIIRYLRALVIRADRAALNPAKDAEKAARVAPYLDCLRLTRTAAESSDSIRSLWIELRWLIEEFKVSTFAQELGTATTVSAKILDARAAALRQAAR